MRTFILFLWLTATTAFAQTPTILDVPGALQTQAFGINNIGQVVGYYQAGDGSQHAFVRDYGASYLELNYPGARVTMANGVNDAGTIVGSYEDANGVIHGFVVNHAGQYSSIDVPDASFTMASGINTQGQIVGYYERAGVYHGFLLKDGAFSDLDVPSSDSLRLTKATYPSGINDAGDIVGGYESISPAGTHGFYYKASQSRFYGVGASGESWIYAVENSGFLVGTTGISAIGMYGHLYPPTEINPYYQLLYKLKDSGCCLKVVRWRGTDWREDYPLGVNNARMIVGYFIGADNRSHGFMFDCGRCN